MNRKTIFYLANAPKNILFRGTGYLMPKQVVLSVTDHCNSKCKSCQIFSSQPKLKALTSNEIYGVFSQPLFSKTELIINTGGETSLRSDLNEIFLAEHEAQPQALLEVGTNGLLPGKIIELAHFCKSKGIQLEVGTSLSGVGEKHDENRGVLGNFDKVVYMLRELQKLNTILVVGCVLTEYTADNIQELRKYLISQFGLELVVQWCNESIYYNNKGVTGISPQKTLEILNTLPDTPDNELWREYALGRSIRFPCYTLDTFMFIKCDGTVVPCLKLWDMGVGNLRNKSAAEIWHSQEAVKARKVVKSCKGCLNSCAIQWSFSATMYPYLKYYVKHPSRILKRLVR